MLLTPDRVQSIKVTTDLMDELILKQNPLKLQTLEEEASSPPTTKRREEDLMAGLKSRTKKHHEDENDSDSD